MISRNNDDSLDFYLDKEIQGFPTPQNPQKKEKELVKLSEEERSLIMGTLLGDAHLQKRGESYRLKIAHSIKQKSYVEWKYKKLQRLCQTTQGLKEETVQPRSNLNKKGAAETKTMILFNTSSGKCLTEFHKLFYKPVFSNKPNEKERFVKTVTQELIDKLPMHPIVLATFFMDDGSARDDCYSGKLATQGFSKEESQLLCQYLKKWNINSNVVAHVVSKNQYYIGLPASTFGHLVEIIEPIVREIPEMVYKLNEINKTP